MMAHYLSDPFPVTNGVNQGWVLAPSLFSIVFSAMLSQAFKDLDVGVYIRFRTDGKLFNLRRLTAKSKVTEEIAREFLFADDCALIADTESDLQIIVDNFSRACKAFGLTISLGKTEVMFQPAPVITNTGHTLKSVSKFKYLGSTMS